MLLCPQNVRRRKLRSNPFLVGCKVGMRPIIFVLCISHASGSHSAKSPLSAFFAAAAIHCGNISRTSGVAAPDDVMSVNATPHANTPLAPMLSCISLMRSHDNCAGCVTPHWRTMDVSKPQSTTRKRHETERGMAKVRAAAAAAAAAVPLPYESASQYCCSDDICLGCLFVCRQIPYRACQTYFS